MLLFTTRKKLELQAVPVKKSSQMIFQNRLFNRGPDFAKNLRDAAINFCEVYSDPQGVCIVEENPSYLTVWREDTQVEEKSTNTTEQKIERIEEKNEKPESVSSQPEKIKLKLEPSFVYDCEQKLAEIIGPIATFFCQRILKENPQIKPSQFVKILTEQIPNELQAIEFRRFALCELKKQITRAKSSSEA
jgi:hypothetical protein